MNMFLAQPPYAHHSNLTGSTASVQTLRIGKELPNPDRQTKARRFQDCSGTVGHGRINIAVSAAAQNTAMPTHRAIGGVLLLQDVVQLHAVRRRVRQAPGRPPLPQVADEEHAAGDGDRKPGACRT